MNHLFKAAIISILLFSCSDDKYIRTYKVNKELMPISWDAPSSWAKHAVPIQMSVASYSVPYYLYDSSNDYADISISILDGE